MNKNCEWIRFYGIYDDALYIVGDDNIISISIESYAIEPMVLVTHVIVTKSDNATMVRNIDRANYDYKIITEMGEQTGGYYEFQNRR